MITVHHLEKSRSHRILWLLEELGVDYEIKQYKRDPKTMLAPPELRKIHPLGKAPIVTDGDVVLAESGAIIEYLVDKYDTKNLIPKVGSPDRLRHQYWLHYAEGSAMPPLLLKLIFETIKKKAPFIAKPIAKAIANKVLSEFVDPQLELHFSYVEAELGRHTWLVGDELTAADIQMSFPIEAAIVRDTNNNSRPRMRAFVDRMRERAAYKRAIERGGAFELL